MKKIQKNLQPLLSQRTLCTKKIQKPSLLHIASSLPLPLLKSISLLLSTALRLLSRPLYEAKQRLPSLPLYETACATPSAPWPNPSAQPHLRPGAPRSLSLPGCSSLTNLSQTFQLWLQLPLNDLLWFQRNPLLFQWALRGQV
ncbi:hypothetical protein AAC387_Pa03g1528 [Persea americana]